ncbi:MAG: Gx transporter family protein [Lachnospiraceae bacterium]|nr:Gx transporter family protein [Lachnospiraceae bacterium]
MRAKVPVLGMLTALSLILSYLETLIPVPFPVPGMKLGLSNLTVVFLLYRYGAKEALLVNLVRILLSAFLFGSISAILFSLSGAACSFAGMVCLKRSGRFGTSGTSIAGGVLHNAGQLVVAAWMVQTYRILYFVAPLIVSGVITGFVIGVLAGRMLSLLPARSA